MKVKEFYQQVALKNYEDHKADPTSYRKLWSTLVSANTVAEHAGLERLDYAPSTRTGLANKAREVRQDYPDLQLLNDRAITLKHVRNYVAGQLTETSTGISPSDPGTWQWKDASGTTHDLREIADRTFAIFRTMPELNDG
jgi:hypothetical protein